ncbi:MAG: phosphoribosylformylglycinamidine synthase subunit PurS [Caldisericales bacterium]|nr:phosphoribosylformylglycinamidine synthase subunit PurS [Caldisericales bacterium]
MYKIEVLVHLKPDILDPQGKTVQNSLSKLGFKDVKSVRVGKSIELEVEAGSQDEAVKIATEMAEKLLSNPVMEVFAVRPK